MRERRAAARCAPSPGDPLRRVRLRAGRELAVVNISSNGVLVEGDVRLLPGMHLDVHVMTSEGRLLVRSRIVRAYVCALTPDVVTYRGAFAFDRAVAIAVGYPLPGGHAAPPVDAGIEYPNRAA
jgi:hypothetical protein